MLTELAVRNLGVIDELSLVFDGGMTAVTGETGAGKTLVVGAIDLLTGGRADASLVRPGAAEAEIEGRFVVGEDDEVVVRRVIPGDGRSRAYIDGHLATVGALAELGGGLIDLHGQHAHQSLLRGPVQRAALDVFGAVDTARLEGLIDDERAVVAALEALGGDARARLREIDLLRHQLAEIDGAAVTDSDEDERLDRAESVLADAAAHREAATAAVGLLDADGPVSDGLGRAESVLADRGPFEELVARIAAASAEVADIAAEARARSEAIDDDPAALAGCASAGSCWPSCGASTARRWARSWSSARRPRPDWQSSKGTRSGPRRWTGGWPRSPSCWRPNGPECAVNGPRPRPGWRLRSRRTWPSWP